MVGGRGLYCSQIKFFEKGGCQGTELDSMVNLSNTGAKFPSNKKALRKWASVASVLCTDAPCDALGCEPGGTCVLDQNGERYCKWGDVLRVRMFDVHSLFSPPSPLRVIPTLLSQQYLPHSRLAPLPPLPSRPTPSPPLSPHSLLSPLAPLPPLPSRPTLSSPPHAPLFVSLFSPFHVSVTFIANRTAKDAASRPLTFRLNLNGCTQFPTAVAGKVETIGLEPTTPRRLHHSTPHHRGHQGLPLRRQLRRPELRPQPHLPHQSRKFQPAAPAASYPGG
ncbi:unnamed protein product [Closterium sp. Naga37s-1]|nr:unnamed protein product [Closterium sp. Naga37s-1]